MADSVGTDMNDSVGTDNAAVADKKAAVADETAAVPGGTQGIFQRANALRSRFRTGDKVRLPVLMLAPHTGNRGGHYPQQERVRELAVKIFLAGFTQAEADHEGVCVQMYPAQELVLRKKEDPKFQTYTEYNLEKATGHLAACFDRSCGTDVAYGTCSHSHLCLVLRACALGAKWPIPQGMEFTEDESARLKRVLDKDGNLDMAAVAEHDPVAKKLVQGGMLMEVLSWKIMDEEPTGASLISQSLNKGADFALRTTELTALRVLCKAVDAELHAAVADQVAFDKVKLSVMHELDRVVQDPDFIELFSFVVGLGSTKAQFIPLLLQFCEVYVNSRRRALRLGAFGAASELPDEVPWVKVAVVMRCYRNAPARKRGVDTPVWCPDPEQSWKKKEFRDFLIDMNSALRLYLFTLSKAIDGMGPEKAIEFKANLCILTADGFMQYLKDTHVKERSIPGHRQALLRACAEATGKVEPKSNRDALEKALGEVGVGGGKPDWFDFNALPRPEPNEPAVAGKTKASAEGHELMPTVISFDPTTQLPTNHQRSRDTTAIPRGSFPLPIAEWRRSAAAKELGREPALVSAVLLCLWARHMSAVAEAQVEVLQDADTEKRTVKATAANDEKCIELWPCVPKASKVHAASTHPERVAVQVWVKGDPNGATPTTFYLHPEFKPPADKTPADVADHDVRLRAWKWDAQETMHVFWAVNRVTEQEIQQRNSRNESAVARINMELETKELAVCVPGTGGVVLAVNVPVLVNTTAVKKGEELLWEARPKTAPKKKAAEETWKTDAAKRAKGKPSGQPAPKKSKKGFDESGKMSL